MTDNLDYTIVDILHEAAGRNGDRLCFDCDGYRLSYTKLDCLSDSLAGYYQSLGMAAGDRVVLHSFNSAEWLVCFFAVLKTGAVAVPVNYALSGDEIISMLKKINVKFFVSGPSKFLSVQPDAKEFILSGLGLDNDRFIDMSLSMNVSGGNFRPAEIKPHDTAVICFTSGSTASPKGVMLSHRNIVSNIYDMQSRSGFIRKQSMLMALPFFHSYALSVILSGIISDLTLYTSSHLNADNIIKIIDDRPVSILLSVGTVYGYILSHPGFRDKISGKIKFCVIGGGFSSAEQLEKIEKMFGNAVILNGYGQTECSPYISIPDINDSAEKRYETVGRPLPGVKLKIVDSEKHECDTGMTGEIAVRGLNVMKGYCTGEKAPIDSEGWLHTGDTGFIDSEGYLHLKGRISDCIIKGGENIAPAEIEEALLKHESVGDVRVFGIKDDVYGENIAACIVPAEGKQFCESEVTEFLRGKITSYKVPAFFVVFDAFPVADGGKTDMKSLKDSLIKSIENNRNKVR